MNPSSPHFEIHLRIDTDQVSAVEHLASASGLSHARVKQLMGQGAVWQSRAGHTQRLRRASRRMRAGDELHLYHDERVLRQTPPAARLIADEGEFSVWYKPPGMWSQGSKWGDHCTITRWAERHLRPQRNALLVHRLDRAAGGLILLAHSKSMARSLSRLFQERRVEKRYRVRVQGRFPAKPSPYLIDERLDGRFARTRVERREFDPQAKSSLLELVIETGRKHQIRRHLAAMGFPVVGDRLYGQPEGPSGLELTAVELSFHHPVSGRRMRYRLSG